MTFSSILGCDDIGVVILAAGFSRRMEAFKPLLPMGTTTVIAQTIDTFQQAGLSRIWVVTGYRGEEVETCLADREVVCVRNEQYEEGMFSSLKTGTQRLGRDLRGFFVMPADMPLVQPATLRALLAAFACGSSEVFYPVCDGRRGHPPLLSVKLREPLLAWQGEGGLRAFLKQYQWRSAEVAVADEGILLDLDNKEDYLRAMNQVDGIQESEFRRFQI
jgi:CTP:molybdopterin cytidylyltransferase MocA